MVMLIHGALYDSINLEDSDGHIPTPTKWETRRSMSAWSRS